MPGLPTCRRTKTDRRKRLLDMEVLSIIIPQVFTLGLALSVRVIGQRYFQEKKVRIPYADFGYPDLISYFASIKGLSVTMNATNGQYQVEAGDNYDLRNWFDEAYQSNEDDNI